MLIEELGNLSAFVDSFGELENFRFDSRSYNGYMDVLRASCRELRARLESQMESQDTHEKLCLFVANARGKLYSFAQDIYGLYADNDARDEETAGPRRQMLFELGMEITDMLCAMRMDFAAYFDQDSPLPAWFALREKEMDGQAALIIHGLGQKAIAPRLVAMLQSFLRSLGNPGEFAIRTWAQYDYLSLLAQELSIFVRRRHEESGTLELIKLLIGQNFNALAFYAYMLSYIDERTADLYSYEDQELELMELLRILGDVRQEKSRGYLADVPPISESISGSINRHLDLIGQQKRLYGITGVHPRILHLYFHLALNIQEVLFLFRVFIETRFARVRRKSLIYDFVRSHIHTETGREPSEQYMRNVFSSKKAISVKVARNVRAWLMIIVSHIDKNYL